MDVMMDLAMYFHTWKLFVKNFNFHILKLQ